MYGFTPYGSIPYGDSPAVLNVEGMLGDQSAAFVYTAEITIWNIATNTASKLYLATREWATHPADFPASQPFRGVLRQALSFRRSLLGGAGIGTFTSDAGSMVIDNADGAFDAIIDTYAIDGREVTVRVGRITDAYADHLLVFKGVATDWLANESTLTIAVRDFGYRLDVPAQPNVYAGTGGADGGADLTGKRKPRVFGLVQGVPGVLVNASLAIYQVNDGALVGIGAVYDRGALLTLGSNFANYAALAAATVSAGTYATCIAEGLFRLGAAPGGVVFCSATTSAMHTADAVASLLAGIDGVDLADATFDVVGSAQPALIGCYLGHDEASTVAQVIEKLMAGIGGWGGFRRDGTFEIGIFKAPSGDPVWSFGEADIISLERERLPAGIWPPPWRWRVACARNWTIFTDFAGAVSAAIRSRYSQPYQLLEASDLNILEDYPRAQDPPPVEAYFIDPPAP